MKISHTIQFARNMGMRYVLYRIGHEIANRLGILVKKFPFNPPEKYFTSLKHWRENKPQFLVNSREKITIKKVKSSTLELSAEKILMGELQFFSFKWYDLGKDYDWLTNPETGYKYSLDHWSKIQDFSLETGDIKYVWEKSRFSYLQTIIRYDYHFDQDNSEWVFSEIDAWIKANPINQGPNWRCSQEISLRLLNWCYALYFYQNSKCLTEERWTVYQNVIYWKLHHIYHNINFSRIAVRNNHAITETGMLFIAGLIFPFISEVKEWSIKGKKWLEEEIQYQIYSDGTFLQFSMNYHRVVVQLLTVFIQLNTIYKAGLSEVVLTKAYKSINFLATCQDHYSGQLPNYGSNDGALFFNWTEAEYRDYRPQLNTLHYLLTGRNLYDSEQLIEDSKWYGITKCSNYNELKITDGIYNFDIGGYYVVRDNNSITFIRCGKHKDRPSQADNLHLDIWVNGENILRDAGSYQYNTSKELNKYFMGTASHNTLMIDEYDQMLKGSRFIWFNWSQAKSVKLLNESEYYEITGSVKVFEYIRKGIVHKRRVRKYKNQLKWEVVDELLNSEGLLIKPRQLWHSENFEKLNIQVMNDNERDDFYLVNGWHSSHYGVKEAVKDMVIPFDKSISTSIEYMS